MANYYYFNVAKLILALAFFHLISFNCFAQCPTIDIVDLRDVPGFAQFDDMSVCGKPDTLALIIYTGDPGTILGFELELDLPNGLEYAGWEFTDFQGTSISNNDPDLNNPVFIVDGFDGDSLIVVNIGILADCDVDIEQALMLNYEYSFNFLDENNIMSQCKAIGNLENELNSAVKTPVLNVLAGLTPAELPITSVGSQFCQSVSISQDGISSYLDEFTFEILGLEFGSDLTLTSITANGTTNVPATFDASTNSMAATVSGAMFLDNGLANPADQQFNTNEVMEFEVCYQINACPASADLPFVYNAYYGCNDQQCQISGQSSFLRIRPTGSMMPTATTTLVSGPFVCGDDGEINLTITNPNTPTDQNNYTDLIVGFETCEAANLGITGVEVGGIALPATAYGWVGDDLFVDFTGITFDPDSGVGLEDIDGDGNFDDLVGGATVDVTMFIGVVCGVGESDPASESCPGNNCPFSQFYVEAKTNCGTSFKNFPSGITGFDINYGPTAIDNPNDYAMPLTGSQMGLYSGYDFEVFGNTGASSQTVEFCYDFAASNFNSCATQDIFLQVHFGGPNGYIYDMEVTAAELSIDGGTNYTATANVATDVTWTAINDEERTLQIALGDDATNVCYRYTLEVDSIWCAVPQVWFGNQQVIERCTDASCGPEGCDLVRACKTTVFHGDANSDDCPCILDGGLREMYRKNYGYTDASKTTVVDRASVSQDDQIRFLPCDTMILEYWHVITDEYSLTLDLQRIVLRNFFYGASSSSPSHLHINHTSKKLLEFTINKAGVPYSARTPIDLKAMPLCEEGGLVHDFHGGLIDDEYGVSNSANSSQDPGDAGSIGFDFRNECYYPNGGGDCLTQFLTSTGYEAGDTLNIRMEFELIKSPYREAALKLGLDPGSSTINTIQNISELRFNDGSSSCAAVLGSDCGENLLVFGVCPGTVSSLSNVELNNCGGSVEHTFYLNSEVPLGWFQDEYRPIIGIYDIDDPLFAPMAYCGNGEVINYVNGTPMSLPIDPKSTDNMICQTIDIHGEICGIESGNQGTLIWNPTEAGAMGLGIGNVSIDSLKVKYDFCLLCPTELNVTDYQNIYDYGFLCESDISSTSYRCNGEEVCVALGEPGNANNSRWGEIIFGEEMDSCLVYIYDVEGPNVTINDMRTPTQNVTATLGTGAATLVASSNPSVSEEIQAIEICNPDPAQTAEGVAATVTVPSSVNFINAYSDAAGTMILNSTLLSDDGVSKIYQVDLNVTSISAGDPCEIIHVGTTLMFCPEVGAVPPSICVAALSGCSPLEIRAALSGADGCGGSEVCYAYVFGEVGLQTEWFDMPASPGLCEPMTFNVLVKNVKELILLDLIATFDLPPGLTVDMTSWEVAYPGGPTTFGSWMPVPPPDQVVDNTYTYTDDNIWSVPAGTPIHSTGLEGVSLANATADNNKVSFRFTATTNCDEFLSGSKMYTESLANDPCMEGNISSGIVESPGIIITGANPADNAQLLVIADPIELNCQASMNTFGITALNISDFPTADSVITCITIPEGLTYVSNSITVTKPAGYNIIGLEETPIGNSLELCFISPPVGISQSMKIQFDAMVDEDMECGKVRMDVDIKSVIVNQACVTGPNCDDFVQNSINPAVTVEIRPTFMAEEWNVYTECGTADEVSLFYEFTIDHNGPDAVNQAYTTNFYEDVDGDGFINSTIDNLITTTNGTFSVNDGRSVTVSGNALVANEDACPLIMELVYATSCACDREELRLENIGLKFLAPYPDPISMCPGDCLEIEVCDFVEVGADSIIGATGLVYDLEVDWAGAANYPYPTPTGPSGVTHAAMTDNSIGDGSANLLVSESFGPDAWLVASYPYPVSVSSVFIGGGLVSGWGNVIHVYQSQVYCLEYSDDGMTWTDANAVGFTGPDAAAIEEYVLPIPIIAKHFRMGSCPGAGSGGNWATSEFRLEGETIPFKGEQPVSRDGNIVKICVPEGIGVNDPWLVEFNTGVGSCENIETLTINNIGDVEITLGPEIVACGSDCVDLEVEIIGDLGSLNNATVSWSPQTGLSDPNSLETEACVSADQTYIATVTFPGGCVKTTSVSIDHQINPSIEVDGADVECFNTKDHPILIAPAGFDAYMWFQVLNGVEIPLGSTLSNTFVITEVGGEYFVKGVSSGSDCPGRSPSYQITERLLPQVCMPVNVNLNR